jgi:hypothetical protein
MRKQLVLLGHLSMLVTFILAIIFYQERTLYVDSGLQVFDIINNGKISILLNRYSLAISQFLPWLAFKAGLPLKYILITYSISFIIVYYICFLICIYGFKNIPAGLSIALAPLIIRFAFGAAICESWMGIAYSALFYAVLNHYALWKIKGYKFHILFYGSLTFTIALNYFIHPSTLFTLVFAILFSLLYKKDFKSIHYYIALLIVLGLYSYKFLFPGHGYEDSFFQGIRMADQLVPNFFQLPVFKFIHLFFYSNYIILVAMFLLSGILFISEKKWWIWVFSLLFSMGYLGIASMAFYKGDAWFMLESRLIPLVFMASIPFLEIIILKKKQIIIYSGAMLLLLGFAYCYLIKQVQDVQTKRIQAYKYYLRESQKYPEHKFYVYLPDNQTTVFNSWGSSHETLMLSSLDNNKNSRTIVFLYRSTNVEQTLHTYPCLFLGVDWRLIVNEEYLNKNYFNLHCTSYRELPYYDHF